MLTSIWDLLCASRLWLQDWEEAHVEPQYASVFAVLPDRLLDTLMHSVLTKLSQVEGSKTDIRVLAMIVVIEHREDERFCQIVDQQELCLHPGRGRPTRRFSKQGRGGNVAIYVRALLVLRVCQFRTLVDAETDIRIGSASTDLCGLQVAGALDSHRQNTNRRVERLAREHLFDIQGKEVRVIHHRAENRVNHIADERRQAGNLETAVLNARIHRGVCTTLTLPMSKPKVSPPMGLRT